MFAHKCYSHYIQFSFVSDICRKECRVILSLSAANDIVSRNSLGLCLSGYYIMLPLSFGVVTPSSVRRMLSCLTTGARQPSRSEVATRPPRLAPPSGCRRYNGAAAFHRFGFHCRCRLPAAAAAGEWKAGWLTTFDPVTHDSAPEPSVALLANTICSWYFTTAFQIHAQPCLGSFC